MEKLPYFKFWPHDWLGDTQLRLCSLETRGLWIDCLSLMHDAKKRGFLETKSGVPINNKMLARLLSAEPDTVNRAMDELITSGVASVADDGVVYSRKMRRDHIKSEIYRENARVKFRKKEEKKEQDSYSLYLGNCSANSTANCSANEKGGRKRAQGFDEFWLAYPRKIGKAAAERAWDRHKPPLEDVLKAIEVQKASDQWQKNDGQFIPHPTTWLNQGRWEDDVEGYNNGDTFKSRFK
jgi:hypothetical protein